jgi:hypothetical protein
LEVGKRQIAWLLCRLAYQGVIGEDMINVKILSARVEVHLTSFASDIKAMTQVLLLEGFEMEAASTGKTCNIVAVAGTRPVPAGVS